MRYFLISYKVKGEISYGNGQMTIESKNFPSFELIKESVDLKGDTLVNITIINVFEFNNKKDYDSFNFKKNERIIDTGEGSKLEVLSDALIYVLTKDNKFTEKTAKAMVNNAAMQQYLKNHLEENDFDVSDLEAIVSFVEKLFNEK